MSEKSIEIGSVVQLKSGGPRMTVDSTSESTRGQSAYCAWFDSGTVKSHGFDVRSLQLIEKDFLDEIIEERASKNPFEKEIEAAIKRRRK